MRLTINNIRFVKRVELNGTIRCWWVSMRSNCVSDLRQYRTDELPATVKRFMSTRLPELHSSYEDELVQQRIYIYRR